MAFRCFSSAQVTGFLAFGEETSGNVLGNLQPLLCANDWVVASGVAGMAFAATEAKSMEKLIKIDRNRPNAYLK